MGVDWSGCDLVERVEGKVSGRSVVRGTRVLAEAVEQYYESGSTVEEIREDFPSLSEETIRRMIEYVKAHQTSAA